MTLNTQPATTAQNTESEQEVSKQADQLIAKPTATASKFTPAYWSPRLFKPTYTRGGERFEVSEWHAQIQFAGRREKVPLGASNREAAARTAAKFYRELAAQGWSEAFSGVLPGKLERLVNSESPTIGDFLSELEKRGSLLPSTYNGYSVSLRWFAARVFNVDGDVKRYGKAGAATWRQRIEGHRLAELTPDKIQDAMKAHVDQFAATPKKQQSARNSVSSMARQARSLFRPKLLKLLPFASVANPFAGVEIPSARISKYVSQIDAETLLRVGQKELSASEPEAYKALLLALGAGLRRGEIDNLQWWQVDKKRNTIVVLTTDQYEAKTANSEDTVFVDEGLIAALEKHRQVDQTAYVIQGTRKPNHEAKRSEYRAEGAWKTLVAWLRGKGVNSFHPVHALRKEFGSIIADAADIHVACNQLRHADIGTTAKYYTDSRKRVAPTIGAFLAKPPMTKNKAAKAGKRGAK